jgi:hypothetical protein
VTDGAAAQDSRGCRPGFPGAAAQDSPGLPPRIPRAAAQDSPGLPPRIPRGCRSRIPRAAARTPPGGTLSLRTSPPRSRIALLRSRDPRPDEDGLCGLRFELIGTMLKRSKRLAYA